MSLLDRLFGRRHAPASSSTRMPRRDADAQAVERYQYLVRTAPPQALEQIHREAFARLTPEQRRRALHDLNASVPPAERLSHDDPASLARMATRAELMRPGTVVSAFGGRGGFGFGGMGMGGLLAGGLLTSFVGSAMGSMLAHQWMDGFHGGHGFDHGFQDGYGDGYGDGFEAGQDAGDAGDVGAADWDSGSDFGDGGWGGGDGFDDTLL